MHPKRGGGSERAHAIWSGVRFALLTLLASLGASAAAAQPRWVRVEGEGSQVDALRADGVARGWTPLEETERSIPGPSREALADLVRVEALIARAREAAARLREGEALDALAEARALVERRTRTPGVTRWLAEVELTTGVVAHQQGRHALAEQSLGRAASLDPDRQLGAAEAPPPVVRRARELARDAASRPQTRLTLRSEAPEARAFLDERPLGPLPVTVESEVGRHVVRIEAPGHRSWGRIVDLTEGRHSPWDVTLSPNEREQRRRRLARAELWMVPTLLEAPAELRWVHVGEGRALVTHCTSAGCADPVIRDADDALEPLDREEVSPSAIARRWNAGLDDLGPDEPATVPPPPKPWWRKGTTWVAVALGAVVAGVALGFSLRPDARQELRVIVDTDDL